MKYFKTEASHAAQKFEITKENFIRETNRQYPFEQEITKKHTSQYGICPSCLNPIQLIGLFHENDNHPYGKHTGKEIDGLPDWNYARYEYCPYSKRKHRPINYEARSLVIDEHVVELYNILRNNFDFVVNMISNELDIRCSKKFWEDSLERFINNRAYCYPGITGMNIPYIFAYFGVHYQSLYKQQVRIDSELYHILKTYQCVELQPENNGYARICNKEGYFLRLFFRFSRHEQGEKEQMTYYVDDMHTNKAIFEKIIEFNDDKFLNMINSESIYRQQWLLDIANDVMPELHKNR